MQEWGCIGSLEFVVKSTMSSQVIPRKTSLMSVAQMYCTHAQTHAAFLEIWARGTNLVIFDQRLSIPMEIPILSNAHLYQTLYPVMYKYLHYVCTLHYRNNDAKNKRSKNLRIYVTCIIKPRLMSSKAGLQ